MKNEFFLSRRPKCTIYMTERFIVENVNAAKDSFSADLQIRESRRFGIMQRVTVYGGHTNDKK